jgi:hypothetical protein
VDGVKSTEKPTGCRGCLVLLLLWPVTLVVCANVANYRAHRILRQREAQWTQRLKPLLGTKETFVRTYVIRQGINFAGYEHDDVFDTPLPGFDSSGEVTTQLCAETFDPLPTAWALKITLYYDKKDRLADYTVQPRPNLFDL